METFKKTNYILLSAGILMIVASVINYQMNKDEVSMGIFVFAGIGFVFNGIKNRFTGIKKQRIQRLSMTFYFIAVVIFVYWLLFAKFDLP
jgi:hypothetical protein